MNHLADKSLNAFEIVLKDEPKSDKFLENLHMTNQKFRFEFLIRKKDVNFEIGNMITWKLLKHKQTAIICDSNELK